MNNFTFYNPTRVVFGKDQLKELHNLVPADANILITYGGGSAVRSGLIDAVKEELAKGSRNISTFGGIEPNPRFSTLMKAIEQARKDNVDFLLAVGGGSVMDGTKFIALAAGEEFVGKEDTILTFGFGGVPAKKALPLGTICTLPATGSEMNNGGVVTNGHDKLFFHSPITFPQFSIIDPSYTMTLPERQVANGIVDTFVHVAEQYVTYPAEGRFQDRTAEGILQTLIEIGEKTLNDPQDYDARANLVWCATMALNGLIGSGVPQDWSAHMLGHEITALYDIDHGRTLAMTLPAIWKVRKEQKKAKLLQFAERVWGLTEGSEEARIDEAIERTEAFFGSLGVPTRFSRYDLGEEVVEKVIANLEKHKMTALSEHGDMTLDVSRQVLQTAL